jgi:hypothetical protein
MNCFQILEVKEFLTKRAVTKQYNAMFGNCREN